MDVSVLLIFLLLSPCGCAGYQEKEEMQSKFWQHATLNGTSSLLSLTNIKTLVKDESKGMQSKSILDCFARRIIWFSSQRFSYLLLFFPKFGLNLFSEALWLRFCPTLQNSGLKLVL